MSRPPASTEVKVKICGVTRPEDAVAAVSLGADLVGLNFYPPSPRAVNPARAREIGAAARESAAGRGVKVVGVVVNRSPADVEALIEEAELDLVQFHGDEGTREVLPFSSRAIKVFRERRLPAPESLRPYGDCWGLLFDAPHARLYGGTGESWDYARLTSVVEEYPVLVAGGVRPDNAGRLIESLPGLFGVDVCSGVESAPGIKDRRLLEQLFSEVRHGKG